MIDIIASLKKNYDQKVRDRCDDKCYKLEQCMNMNFNTPFDCSNEINDLKECLLNFDKEINEKNKAILKNIQ